MQLVSESLALSAGWHALIAACGSSVPGKGDYAVACRQPIQRSVRLHGKSGGGVKVTSLLYHCSSSADANLTATPTNCRQPRGERYCAGAPVRWGSPGCWSRFLRSRSVPARMRSRAVRAADARSSALLSNLRGRPGGRRPRLNASRSFGKMAQTGPTLIPYRRFMSSNRRT